MYTIRKYFTFSFNISNIEFHILPGVTIKYSKKINAYNKMCCGERDGFFINKETLANKMVPAISDKNQYSRFY